jgi:hypothetical protein
MAPRTHPGPRPLRPAGRLLGAGLLLSGCLTQNPDSTLLKGTVFDAADAAQQPLGGATVDVFDATGARFGTTTADDAGAFEVDAPFAQVFSVVMSADGFVPTSATGYGSTEITIARDGDLFARSEAWLDEERGRFAGCFGADAGGPVVEGILRAELPVPASDYDTLPVVRTGRVDLAISDTAFQYACYLDDDGVAYDPEAEVTGDSGRFAFFDPPPNAWATLTSTWTDDTEAHEGGSLPVFVPAGGVASLDPLFAAAATR